MYFGDPISGHTTVPAGQSFSLGNVNYYSDPAAPTNGHGKIDFNQVAPAVTAGWKSLLPHNSGHFTIPFEFGVVFQGSAKTNLNLSGSVCSAPGGVNCLSVANPTVQSSVVGEQSKLNNSMSLFKAYPILSIGLGYSF